MGTDIFLGYNFLDCSWSDLIPVLLSKVKKTSGAVGTSLTEQEQFGILI